MKMSQSYGHLWMASLIKKLSPMVIHHDNLNIQPYGWKAPAENCTLRGAAAETILPRFDTMINLVVKAAYGSFQSGSKFITKIVSVKIYLQAHVGMGDNWYWNLDTQCITLV